MIPDPTEADMARDSCCDYAGPQNAQRLYADGEQEVVRKSWIRRAVHAEQRCRELERQLAIACRVDLSAHEGTPERHAFDYEILGRMEAAEQRCCELEAAFKMDAVNFRQAEFLDKRVKELEAEVSRYRNTGDDPS